MQHTTEQSGQVTIVRVAEPRLTYPLLEAFSAAVTGLVTAGRQQILIDLTPVTYVDSAAIGCLMDIYRRVSRAGGRLKLSGVQTRVRSVLTLTGTERLIDMHDDEPAALRSFEA